MASRTDPIEGQFFSQRNRNLLTKAITDDFGRRGVNMNGQQQQARLDKTLQHYMDEVYEVNGSQPLQFLNKEVVSATITDFASYIRRQDVTSVNLVQTQIPTLPGGMQQNGSQRAIIEDTGTAFERLQNERTDKRPMPKNIPDFRISVEEDSSVNPMALYEQAQKQREEEAAAVLKGSAAAGNSAMTRFVNATDSYSTGFSQKNSAIENALVERSINRMVNGLPSFPVLPQELMPLSEPVERTQPNANPTIAITAQRTKESLPQDNIIRQSDILTYKETEYNLFVNSGDRDWLNNKNDTRYNFTVNFSPANNRQGFGMSPAAQVRFKNIARIELVKSIMPAEGLDILVRRRAANVVDANNTDAVINALSFPYVSVKVAELDNNNYGTNNTIDNTFGILQYDANWVSESIDVKNDLTLSRGYLAMIPKFMKSQKVYSPTPLASLQRLTISFQRPDGSLLSEYTDTLNITGIIPSERLSGTTLLFGSNVVNTQAVYTTGSNLDSEYYWIQTAQWFPRHMFNEGDRINIGGLNISELIGNSNYNNTTITSATTSEFTNYFTGTSGLLISGVGFYYKSGTSNIFSSGGYLSNGVTTCANSLGYANCLIVQAKYNDPTTGNTSVRPFGGNTANNIALGQALVGGSNGPLYNLPNVRLINMSHQTQLVFRIITREMDSTSMVRPDNL